MTFLINTDDVVLFDLPGDKPDAKACYTLDNAETRPRVKQSPTKHSQCGYYALNRVRPRIGKNPPEVLKPARAIEVAYSQWRKKQSELSEKYSYLEFSSTVFHSENGGNLSELKAKGKLPAVLKMVIETIRKHKDSSDEEVQRSVASYRAIYPEIHAFSKSDEPNFLDFLRNKRFEHAIAIHQETLNQMDPTIDFSDVEGLSVPERFALLHDRVKLTFCEKMPGMRLHTFADLALSELIVFIQKNGPFVVHGNFGPSFYQQPAKTKPLSSLIPNKEVKGSVFYWSKGTDRKHFTVTHTAVVCGAQTGSGDYVYYQDPNQPGDLFLTSFKSFKQHALSINSTEVQSIDNELLGQKHSDTSLGYELANPLARPQSSTLLVAYSKHQVGSMKVLVEDSIGKSSFKTNS